MSRKAEPPVRRSPRRRPATAPDAPLSRPARKAGGDAQQTEDSDFGLCLAIAPALRRRGDV